MRQLTRSREQRIVGGVCGGIAEFFGLDVFLVRLLWVLLSCFAGSGIFLYLALWVIIPQEGAVYPSPIMPAVDLEELAKRRTAVGWVFVALGSVLLLQQFFPWFKWKNLWPLLLIFAGGWLLFQQRGGE